MQTNRGAAYDAYIRYATDDSVVAQACTQLVVQPLPTGFPFLVSATTGQVIEPVIAYMASRFLVRSIPKRPIRMRYSENTRQATVSDLNHFLDHLDASCLQLEDISDQLVEGYAGSMIGQMSLATGREYAFQTISRRMSTIRGFANWLQNEGRLPTRLSIQDNNESHKKRGAVQGIEAGRLNGVEVEDLTINVLSVDEAKVLTHALGQLPSVAMKGTTARNRLALTIALHTGLRRSEVASLRVTEVLHALAKANASHGASHTMEAVKVVGKGRKKRNVLMPVWLLREIDFYMNGERAEAIGIGRMKEGKKFVEPNEVLVNGPSARVNVGHATSGDTIYQAFHKAQSKLVATGQLSQHFRFHDLRHTYATWTWVLRKRSGDARPSKFIQSQLGHKDPQTTEAIYLSAVALFEAKLFDHVAKELDLRSMAYA